MKIVSCSPEVLMLVLNLGRSSGHELTRPCESGLRDTVFLSITPGCIFSSRAVRLVVCQHVPLGSNPTQPWTNTNSCSSLKILKGQTSTRNHWPHPGKWFHRLSFWVFAAAAFCFLLHNRRNTNLLTPAQNIPLCIFIITLLIIYCMYSVKSHINRNVPYVV